MPDAADANATVWKSDQGVSYWVSGADERERRHASQRRLMAELLPFSDDEPFVFIDLGAGTGDAARAVLDRYPAARAILADFSAQMTENARNALAGYADRCRYVEFDLTRAGWPTDIPPTVDAVISSLCVHHLPDERKQQLFREIFARLVPGGWYLNYDPVTAPDSDVEAVWQRVNDARDPAAAHKRANRTPYEQLRYENHVRHMIPLAPQIDFLRAAGFEAVDVYWKELDYVLYGGRRPVAAS